MRVIFLLFLYSFYCRYALGSEVKLAGEVDSKFSNTNQAKNFQTKIPSQSNSGQLIEKKIDVEALLDFSFKGKEEGENKYGAFIRLNANTSKAKREIYNPELEKNIAEQVMFFYQNKFGRFEIGSYTGVTDAMKVNAASFASATGGIDGDVQFYWNPSMLNNKLTRNSFLQTPNLYTNDLGMAAITGKNANKINYYTPEFRGLSFGVSYTPDVKSYGTLPQARQKDSNAEVVSNIMELGVNYNVELQDINLSFGMVGQTGNLKVQNKSFQGLEVGTNINYRNFIWGGSYGYLSNGLAQTKKNNPFWTAGVGYAQGPVTLSLTYFESKLYKSTNNIANKLSNIVIGMDYRVSKGFLPYFEIARFKMDDTEVFSNNNNNLNKGIIILSGCKIKF